MQLDNSQATLPQIFISYRHADAVHEAARIRGDLVDALELRFAQKAKADVEAAVFLAPMALKVGQDFAGEIGTKIAKSAVLVAVIGPRWRGWRWFRKPRIFDKEDWVRKELELAHVSGLPVMPVRVSGARKLHKGELPSSLQFLCDLHECEIGNDWAATIAPFLRTAVEKAIDARPPAQVTSPVAKPRPDPPDPGPWLRIAAVILLVVAPISWLLSRKTHLYPGEDEVLNEWVAVAQTVDSRNEALVRQTETVSWLVKYATGKAWEDTVHVVRSLHDRGKWWVVIDMYHGASSSECINERIEHMQEELRQLSRHDQDKSWPGALQARCYSLAEFEWMYGRLLDDSESVRKAKELGDCKDKLRRALPLEDCGEESQADADLASSKKRALGCSR